MLDTALLPTLNALLNATTALLLVRGWWLVRRGEHERHRVAMLGACVGSALFLTFQRLDPAGLLTNAAPGSGSFGTAIAGAVLALPALLVLAMTRKAFDLRPHPVDNA